MEPASRIGTQYAGRYEILKLIGQGGMGAVFEAKHMFTDRVMALKIIHRTFATSNVARQRVLREARAPTAIEHPAIVQILDAGEAEDGSLYLAMERLFGRDLSQAIGAGAVTTDALVRIIADVLDGLGAAHQAGLIHRDIKPANIFVSMKEGRARTRLLDFGITRDVGSESHLTREGTVMGTPHFMSPEQAQGQKVDGRSDIWSVGAVLFDALSGEPPFRGNNYSAVIAQLVTTEPRSLRGVRPDLPLELCQVVDRALGSNRDARWSSAQEMRGALLGCADQVTGMALPPSKAAKETADTALSVRPPPNSPPAPHAVGADGQTFGAQPGAAQVPNTVRDAIPKASPTPPLGQLPGGANAPVSAPHLVAAGGAESVGSGTNGHAPSSAPARPTKPRGRLLLWLALLLVPAVLGGMTAAFFAIRHLQADPPPVMVTEDTSGPTTPPALDPVTTTEAPMVPIDPETPLEPTEMAPAAVADPEVTAEIERLVEERLQEREDERRARAAVARAARERREAEEATAMQRRCNTECSQEMHACRRSGEEQPGECHRQWSRCLRGCR